MPGFRAGNAASTSSSPTFAAATRRAWLGAALALVSALGGWGCGSHPMPVSKIVNGRVVVTRAISPAAYEHAIRAQLYEEEQRWDDAALELQRALTFDDEAAELRAHLADVLLRLDRADDAASEAAASLKTALTVAGYLATAHVAEARRDLKTALGQYQSAARLAREQEDPEAIESSHLALASAQLVGLDVEGAHDTVATLRDLNAGSLQARVQLAALAWATGRLPEAEAALGEALAIEPAEVDARLMLAALYVATGRTTAAKAAFREAIERAEESTPVVEMYLRWLDARGDRVEAAAEADRLTPDIVDESTVTAIMRIERASGRPERALAAATAAIRGGVPAARVALLAAGAAAESKDVEGATRMLLQVPKGAPEFVDCRLRAAEILREAGTPEALTRAGKVLDEVELDAETPPAPTPSTSTPPVVSVKEKPGPPEGSGVDAAPAAEVAKAVAIARALLAEKRGDGLRAARALDIALRAYPDDARLLLARGGVEERRGDWRHALGYAEQILARDPRNVEALNFHGFVSADHGSQLATTTRRLQVAVVLDPGAGGIVDSLGWAYLQSGTLAPAAEWLTEADRLEPRDPEILSHLGNLHERQHQPERAIASYREALTHSPSDRVAAQIQARLRELGARQAAGR